MIDSLGGKLHFSVWEVAAVVVAVGAGPLGDLRGRKQCYATHDQADRQFLHRPDYSKLLPKLISSPWCLIGRRRALCQQFDWLVQLRASELSARLC